MTNANRELAQYVAQRFTGLDINTVGLIIIGHQTKFPGGWQDWTVAEMAPVIEDIVLTANRMGETSPERIIQMCS